jgi:hypothetical protein
MTGNYSDFLIDTLTQAEEAIRQLQAENEALRKDAMRYRWLRVRAVDRDVEFDIQGETPEELDAILDSLLLVK